MADTLKRMIGPKTPATSATTEYTAPSGSGSTVTAAIRFIHVSNPTAADATFTMSIGSDASGTRLFDAFTVPAHKVFRYACNFPIIQGEIVQVFQGTASALIMTVGGVEIA